MKEESIKKVGLEEEEDIELNEKDTLFLQSLSVFQNYEDKILTITSNKEIYNLVHTSFCRENKPDIQNEKSEKIIKYRIVMHEITPRIFINEIVNFLTNLKKYNNDSPMTIETMINNDKNFKDKIINIQKDYVRVEDLTYNNVNEFHNMENPMMILTTNLLSYYYDFMPVHPPFYIIVNKEDLEVEISDISF